MKLKKKPERLLFQGPLPLNGRVTSQLSLAQNGWTGRTRLTIDQWRLTTDCDIISALLPRLRSFPLSGMQDPNACLWTWHNQASPSLQTTLDVTHMKHGNSSANINEEKQATDKNHIRNDKTSHAFSSTDCDPCLNARFDASNDDSKQVPKSFEWISRLISAHADQRH